MARINKYKKNIILKARVTVMKSTELLNSKEEQAKAIKEKESMDKKKDIIADASVELTESELDGVAGGRPKRR